MHGLSLFAQNVFSHQLSWVAGILTLVGLIELVSSKKILIPRKWAFCIGLALLFVACCQAWFDEHRNVETLVSEKAALTSRVKELEAENAFKDKPIFLQEPPSAKNLAPAKPSIQQKSEGPNSPNIVGNGNTVNPPVNPNKLTVTYTCDGLKVVTGVNAQGTLIYDREDEPQKDFNAMADMVNAGKYDELIKECQARIKSDPEWLTPYLFCGVGYLNQGQKDKTREMLSYVDGHSGPTYEQGECKKISDYLRLHRSQQ